MTVWLCGCVIVWLCGCVVVWLCGCVIVWLCGCVVVRLCGCVVVCGGAQELAGKTNEWYGLTKRPGVGYAWSGRQPDPFPRQTQHSSIALDLF